MSRILRSNALKRCEHSKFSRENYSRSANNAGCRIYRDNTSYNYQVILQDDFEDNNINGWSTGEISNDSVKKDGHSLKFDNIIDYDLSSADLVAGDNYAVTYLARSSESLSDGEIIIRDDNGILASATFNAGADWDLYSINLGVLKEGNYTNPKLQIDANRRIDINLDWIILKRINNLLVIKKHIGVESSKITKEKFMLDNLSEISDEELSFLLSRIKTLYEKEVEADITENFTI